jgi:hypothetical protein
MNDEELISEVTKVWEEFSSLANQLTKRGFLVTVESGWEILQAPFDEEITQMVIEKDSNKLTG